MDCTKLCLHSVNTSCQRRHTLTCVSNNIVQHYQPLKLGLQLLPDVLW